MARAFASLDNFGSRVSEVTPNGVPGTSWFRKGPRLSAELAMEQIRAGGCPPIPQHTFHLVLALGRDNRS